MRNADEIPPSSFCSSTRGTDGAVNFCPPTAAQAGLTESCIHVEFSILYEADRISMLALGDESDVLEGVDGENRGTEAALGNDEWESTKLRRDRLRGGYCPLVDATIARLRKLCVPADTSHGTSTRGYHHD
jgi:hypothetical protein